MKESDIVLVKMPQSDGQNKIRPALVLKALPRFNDYLLCGISSMLHQQMHNIDELLLQKDNYFSSTSLRQDSLIRLFFISVKPASEIFGILGHVPLNIHRELLRRLSSFLLS